MNCEQAINWLYSFHKYGSQLGLERINLLDKKLGFPHKNYDIIHVSGTNGKGSVSKLVGSILEKSGYSVGVYISPHLERFSERIVVNNTEISNNDFASLVNIIKPIVDDMIKENCTPTFFEITTALAFMHFKQKNVDFAVVEVGLGGRFDATNIVNPLVSVITNISLEHTDKLGKDVQSIAFEKAGIIKKEKPVVTAAVDDALKIIKKISDENNSSLTIVKKNSWKRLTADSYYQTFLVHGCLKDFTVQTKMQGLHQGENIALAIFTAENLQINGVYIPEESIIEGVKNAFNPGRMEIFNRNPTVLIDGAHNPVGMLMLKQTLKKDFTYDHLILVIGILSNKDVKKMLSIIVPESDIIIVTASENQTACKPEKLNELIKNLDINKTVVSKEKISDAIDHARKIANKKDLICCTGSLFTVGEARKYMQS